MRLAVGIAIVALAAVSCAKKADTVASPASTASIASASASASAATGPHIGGTQRKPMTVVVTKDENGSTQDLLVGDTLKISLDENPSTGYAWKVTTAPAAAVLEKKGDEMIEPTPEPTGPPIAGRGGTHVWTYDAVGKGSTTVELKLYPPGTGTSPSDTFTVHVEVTRVG